MLEANWEIRNERLRLVFACAAETVLTFCQLAAASPVLELHPQLDGNQTLWTESV